MGLSEARCQAIITAFEQRAKVPWGELVDTSSEIVLFGSWAVGKETPRSDIDLLCVDYHRRAKAPGLDLLAYPRSFIESEEWLASELAVHIAYYGVLLKGDGAWRKFAHITPETITRKKEQVLTRAVRLSCSLQDLSKARSLEVVKLRRDLQRLLLLSEGSPTPPTALLDEEWSSNRAVRDACKRHLTVTAESVLGSLSQLGIEIGQLTVTRQ